MPPVVAHAKTTDPCDEAGCNGRICDHYNGLPQHAETVHATILACPARQTACDTRKAQWCRSVHSKVAVYVLMTGPEEMWSCAHDHIFSGPVMRAMQFHASTSSCCYIEPYRCKGKHCTTLHVLQCSLDCHASKEVAVIYPFLQRLTANGCQGSSWPSCCPVKAGP